MKKPVSQRKIVVLCIAALLVSLISSACFPLFPHEDPDPDETANASDTGAGEVDPTPGVPPELDFVVEDLDEELVIDTYADDELLGTRYLYLYDAEYFDLFFDEPEVTEAECMAHIDANEAIPEKFKALLRTFVSSIVNKYPEADIRPLDFNIQTLEVVECDEFELAMHTLSLDAYGCYVRDENRIYVPKDYDYVPGTWEYQVIMHEFGHAARTVSRQDDKLSLSIGLSSFYCEIPEEALNSIFTVSLFDYEERDIAYQFQSNMFLILTECLEGYSLSDYLNHSLGYFAHMLDEQNGNNNYAMSILQLIGEQRADWANDEYERAQTEYYPIYDYITGMYVDKYAAPGMTEGELTALIDGLVERVMFDVPE